MFYFAAVQRFEGRTAIVTGAASGIGRATVERLVDEGATVVAVDVQPPGVGIEVVGDIADAETSQRAVATALDATGSLHVLANVAGILRTARTHEHPRDTWDQVLAVNLTGTFLACQAAIPALLETGGGAIVNTASTAALAGHPWAAAYSASKGGVLAMTLPIARDLMNDGIRINTILPGVFKTPMVAGMPEQVQDALGAQVPFPKRLGKPDEYAQLARFLIESTYMNAASVRLDGGIRMAPR